MIRPLEFWCIPGAAMYVRTKYWLIGCLRSARRDAEFCESCFRQTIVGTEYGVE